MLYGVVQAVDLSSGHGPNHLILTAIARRQFSGAIQEAVHMEFPNAIDKNATDSRSITQLVSRLHQVWGKRSWCLLIIILYTLQCMYSISYVRLTGIIKWLKLTGISLIIRIYNLKGFTLRLKLLYFPEGHLIYSQISFIDILLMKPYKLLMGMKIFFMQENAPEKTACGRSFEVRARVHVFNCSMIWS